jgi:hypothetical protein
MARKAKLNWEVYREQLVELRYVQRKSLTDINKILFDKLGFCFTNARLSQIFSQWKDERSAISDAELDSYNNGNLPKEVLGVKTGL